MIQPPPNPTREEADMATTARQIMTPDPECARASDTVLDTAQKMARLGVGALPICGEDNRLKGMLTDRDIVVKVLAEGKDPSSVKASEIAQGDGTVVTVGADDSVEEALATMKQHEVRRLPVIDGHDLVGIISVADVARNLDESKLGDLVEAISN